MGPSGTGTSHRSPAIERSVILNFTIPGLVISQINHYIASKWFGQLYLREAAIRLTSQDAG